MRNFRNVMLPLLLLLVILATALNCGAGSEKDSDGDDSDSGSGDTDDDAGSGDGVQFALTSSAFFEGGAIPLKYSCGPESDYKKPTPPLAWSGAPAGTKSFVLLFDDLHQVADGWVHWLVIDIPAATKALAEGAGGHALPAGAKELKNSWGESGYGGPCPPPPTGKHIYRMQLFAMPDAQTTANFDGRNGAQITETLKAKALGVATLNGVYDRSGK